MDDQKNDIFVEAAEFCSANEIALSTLGLRALGNGRFFNRLERKRADEQRAIERLRIYMQSQTQEAAQ